MRTSFFKARGTLDRSEVRFGKGGEYGYAKLRIADRATGRVAERTVLAFGEVYQAMRDCWYDGCRGSFGVAARGGSLVATSFEPG